ncbi:15-hydroxyprostaglandin dehydrogenase [NAD(+)] [Chaetomidium leptoderma]|uniref:15-hydroxyprostaglandin dehydrogenase [NAD(+)] n=1 Tax=Chaetomidium leptoderma TaxID=669021 RepID=A0AAN7A1C9_9PEZI|nr:15-hydroxyprostaglandin dehydrogenase [NAD(+)] [Chaetomidium leptoderma]
MGSVQNEAKVAIITGGTSGIGFALAQHLHAKGWRVAIVGRRADLGAQKASYLDPLAETAAFEQCDVASYSAQAAMFKNVWARWGRLDLLIANAGSVDSGSWDNFRRRGAAVDDLPPEPDTTCTDAHLKGLIFPEYGAVEAGVIHWVRVNAPLLKRKEKITINTVMMGPAITPVMPGFAKAFLPEQLVLPATIIKAYDLFIDDDDNKRTGETVETAHDQLFWYEMPEHKAGKLNVRNMLVYEPWFAVMYGEKSGLEDALQEAPEGNAQDTGRVEEFGVGMM